MNPLPTRQNCNPKTICALIEIHRRYEDLFSYHEDRYSRYEEPVYEYEGVRAENYKHNEDPTFMIRVEDAKESEEDYLSDYQDLIDTLQMWDELEILDTQGDVRTTEDGAEVTFEVCEFEVGGESADWLTPTLLAYGSLHLDSTLDDTVTYFCDRHNLEYFNIRNHFVVRGEEITESFRDPSMFSAKLSDSMNSEHHAGTDSASMNIFIPE